MPRFFPFSQLSPSAGPGGAQSGRRFGTLGLGFGALGGFAALLPWLPVPRGAAGVDLTLLLWAALGAALARAMRGAPEARPALAGFAGLAAAALAAGAVPGGGVEALALVAGLGFLTGGVFAILFGARLPGGGPLASSGALALVFGLAVFWDWPAMSGRTLEWLLGGNLMATAAALVALAVRRGPILLS